ncbi:MAG TPA: SPFH domain-containing protein, partial [Terriglobales bacterium]
SRDKLAAEITRVMQEALHEDGFVIEGVQLENIEFGKAYTQGIEDAARAEADVRKKRQELEQNRVTAESVKINADAAAYQTRAQADAEAYRIKAKGEAEAAAIQARADALKKNQDLVALIAAEKWDGKLPATMVPGSAVPFIGVK